MSPIMWGGRNTLSIDEESKTPKYQQIVTLVQRQITNGTLKGGERIPSINETSEEYYLSRDTVEKAYRILKKQGIIESVRGKGYYITDKLVESRLKICLIFNKLSSYKKIIYNAFVQELGENAQVDLYVHHCNTATFLDLLNRKLDSYDKYVIMPHFNSLDPEVLRKIKEIPSKKLILLDKYLDGFDDAFGMVYQNFEMDIYEALQEARDYLKPYKELILVYPENPVYPYPSEIKAGFKKFCQQNSCTCKIIPELGADTSPVKQATYIIIEENDLVNLVKSMRKLNWKAGKDVGILSYNETPIKEVLEEGISVISTDFEAMGKLAALMITNDERIHRRNDFRFIPRNSL